MAICYAGINEAAIVFDANPSYGNVRQATKHCTPHLLQLREVDQGKE